MLAFADPLADTPIADAPFGHVDGARTWPFTIAGHGFIVDHTKSQIKTVPALRQAQDVGTEPGGRTLSVEGSWKRTRASWVGGAGQFYADDADSDPTRFLLSANLDVWDPDGPSLRSRVIRLPDSRLGSPNSSSVAWTRGIGLIYAAPFSVGMYATPTDHLSPLAATGWREGQATLDHDYIRSIVLDPDKYLYVSGVSDTYRIALSVLDLDAFFDPSLTTDPVLWSTDRFDRMAICHGFFVASFEAVIYTVDAGGTSTLLWTYPTGAPDLVSCGAIVEAANGIYLGFTNWRTSTGSVYFVGLDTTTGGLKQPVKVADLPRGEQLNAMIAYSGFLILGTGEGVRVARINDDDTITYGSVICVHDYGAPGTDRGKRDVYGLGAFRDRVYFGVADIAVAGSGVRSGLGVLNLSHFVDPENLVPAWTLDVMGPPDCTGYVSAVVVGDGPNDRDDWGVYFYANDPGLWYLATSSYSDGFAQQHGWLEQGWFAFDSTEPKQFLSLDVRADPPGGAGSARVDAWLQVDKRVDVSVAVYPDLYLGGYDGDTADSGAPWGIGLDAERVNPIVRVTRDDSSITGHQLRDLTVRAVPAPERVDELVLALVAKRSVETPLGTVEGVDVRAEYEFIKSLESTQAVCRCALGGRSFFARVADVQLDATGWDDDTDWFAGVLSVRLVTTERFG